MGKFILFVFQKHIAEFEKESLQTIQNPPNANAYFKNNHRNAYFCQGDFLLQQLHQHDGGASRLMWSVGRVAVGKAGISLSITSNHSCSMPSAACLEHLHSRLLAAAFLPIQQTR